MILLLLFIVGLLWMLFVIETNMDGENKTKTSNMKFKHTNNTISNEGIIYPIHIKYKMLERNEILYPTNTAYANNVKMSPVYKCIIDDEIATVLSMGQEVDLDVSQGEHSVFFENSVVRNKTKNKYIKHKCKT